MRIDNYSYTPVFQGLDINENTIKYVAKNVSKDDLPIISAACDLFEASKIRNFSFDSSKGHLSAAVSEMRPKTSPDGSLLEPLINEEMTFATMNEHKRQSITNIFRRFLRYLEDIDATTMDVCKQKINSGDYNKRFEKYI